MNKNITRKLLLPALIVVGFSGNTLADGIELKCSYTRYFSVENKSVKKVNPPFDITFSYDTITQDAFISGNMGVTPVSVHIGEQGMTFIENLITGAVQTTTVMFSDFSSVHSRHTMFFGIDLSPSQYYGFCGRNTR